MKKSYFFLKLTLIISMFLTGFLFSQTTPVPLVYLESEGFVAHEWGTFTTLRSSDGLILSGLEKEEEALPNFVQNICFCRREQKSKGYPIYNKYDILKNVTVKMETPVIYFYSIETSEKKVSVDVQFPKGSISQWYPVRSDGETLDPSIILQLNYTPSPPPETIDFSIPHHGFIRWEASVLPKASSPAYSNLPGRETPQWLAQRETASNLIAVKNAYANQIEKFLFYRGIGDFVEPINIFFNTSGNLVLNNLGSDTLSYVLVYERKKDSSVIVHWSGSLNGQTKKVVKRTGGNNKDPLKEMEKFVSHLVSAGLYEDEARAMLKTWQKSYFEHEGLKVFWIVPSAFADEILPLKIEPQPDRLKRVFIGRSEILTPEFEKELTKQLVETHYANDRFGNAYKELMERGIPSQWSEYNTLTEDEETSGLNAIYSQTKKVEFYPNPVSGELTVEIYDEKNETITINVFNIHGSLAISFTDIKKGKNTISLENLPNGVYAVKVQFEDGKFISKRMVKR